MHGSVREAGYSGKLLDLLANLNLAANIQLKGEQYAWFLPFYRAYVTYLSKIPSINEVYVRAQSEDEAWYDGQTLLIDMFRLVNHINLIINPLNSTFRILGRYYKDSSKVYRQIYKLIKE